MSVGEAQKTLAPMIEALQGVKQKGSSATIPHDQLDVAITSLQRISDSLTATNAQRTRAQELLGTVRAELEQIFAGANKGTTAGSAGSAGADPSYGRGAGRTDGYAPTAGMTDSQPGWDGPRPEIQVFQAYGTNQGRQQGTDFASFFGFLPPEFKAASIAALVTALSVGGCCGAGQCGAGCAAECGRGCAGLCLGGT